MLDNYQENIFKPGQIVCLEQEHRYLYGEVIQVVVQRQLCWARPLTIAILPEKDCTSFILAEDIEIIDLRSANDLLLPLSLFRAGYDTEVIGLLTQLATREYPSDKQRLSLYLNQFIREVCEQNPEKFARS